MTEIAATTLPDELDEVAEEAEEAEEEEQPAKQDE